MKAWCICREVVRAVALLHPGLHVLQQQGHNPYHITARPHAPIFAVLVIHTNSCLELSLHKQLTDTQSLFLLTDLMRAVAV
jgi:hypothetical protein